MTLLSQLNAVTYQQAVSSSFFQTLSVPADSYVVEIAPHIYIEGHSSVRPPHFGNFQLFQSPHKWPVYVAALYSEPERVAATAARPTGVSDNAGHYMFVGRHTARDQIRFSPAHVEVTSRSDVTTGRIRSSLTLHDFDIDALLRLGNDDMVEFRRSRDYHPYELAYWLGGPTLAGGLALVSDPDTLWQTLNISAFHFFRDAPFLNYYHDRNMVDISTIPEPDEEVTQRIVLPRRRGAPPPPPPPRIPSQPLPQLQTQPTQISHTA